MEKVSKILLEDERVGKWLMWGSFIAGFIYYPVWGITAFLFISRRL